MLDDISDQLSTINHCPEHLGNRFLRKDPLVFSFNKEAGTDRTALDRYDLYT